jgi:hypothetical protein
LRYDGLRALTLLGDARVHNDRALRVELTVAPSIEVMRAPPTP